MAAGSGKRDHGDALALRREPTCSASGRRRPCAGRSSTWRRYRGTCRSARTRRRSIRPRCGDSWTRAGCWGRRAAGGRRRPAASRRSKCLRARGGDCDANRCPCGRSWCGPTKGLSPPPRPPRPSAPATNSCRPLFMGRPNFMIRQQTVQAPPDRVDLGRHRLAIQKPARATATAALATASSPPPLLLLDPRLHHQHVEDEPRLLVDDHLQDVPLQTAVRSTRPGSCRRPPSRPPRPGPSSGRLRLRRPDGPQQAQALAVVAGPR